jgi:hypothetical protein
MSGKRIIPITAIMCHYHRLRKMPQAERLVEAQHLVKHPEDLATEFATSVEHFKPYANFTDHFYPSDRTKRAFGGGTGAKDLVGRMEAQKRVFPVDARARLTEHDGGPTVTAVPAVRLISDYVDWELLVQRTTSPAEWEDGTDNVGGVRLDLLLADAADRTPIVGELKSPGDMDPFFALFQALTCAAHLATPNQYGRMRAHLHGGKFPELPGVPRLDVWVVFVYPTARQERQMTRGTKMKGLKAAAESLAPKLLAKDDVSISVRRIAALSVSLDDVGPVIPEVLWAWERTSA